jgi:hypothetical protein
VFSGSVWGCFFDPFSDPFLDPVFWGQCGPRTGIGPRAEPRTDIALWRGDRISEAKKWGHVFRSLVLQSLASWVFEIATPTKKLERDTNY